MENIVNEDEVIKVLRNLVRIPTQNPPGNEKRCSEYIVEQMQEWGIDAKLIAKPFKDRPQAVATYGSGNEPTLVLNGHLDVVPEGSREEWEFDPYSGVVKAGKLYGRGAADMKAGIAAGMLAAKVLKEGNVNLRGTLLLQFAIGEETAEPGTKTLLEEGYRGNWGIVLEPTNLRTATSEKGLTWYEITVKGKPCHASRPWKGKNAIIKATKVIQALEKYDKDISVKTDLLLGRAIASITMINGGIKENVIPELCKITVDRRILPKEPVEEVDKEIRELLEKISQEDPEFEYEWKRTRYYEPAEIPVDSEIAEVVRKHSKEIAGVSDEPFGTIVSTDVRNFINDAGIPAITWGPGDPDQAHTFNESVEIQEIIKAIEVLIATIRELLE